MKLVSTLLVILMLTTAAHATPGDTGCEGETADGKAIDVLIGYDNFGEGPSLLEVTVDDKKVFSSTDVKDGLINMGSETSPFILNGITATDVATQSFALITFPEQEPSEDGSYDGVLSLTVGSKQVLANAEIKCQR